MRLGTFSTNHENVQHRVQKELRSWLHPAKEVLALIRLAISDSTTTAADVDPDHGRDGGAATAHLFSSPHEPNFGLQDQHSSNATGPVTSLSSPFSLLVLPVRFWFWTWLKWQTPYFPQFSCLHEHNFCIQTSCTCVCSAFWKWLLGQRHMTAAAPLWKIPVPLK